MCGPGIRIDEHPVGAVVHFACHATHMNGLLYSADYVKWVVDTVRAVYGPAFGAVFLNGACGDVTQVDNRSPRPLEMGPYWAERSGRCVGGAAVQGNRVAGAAENALYVGGTSASSGDTLTGNNLEQFSPHAGQSHILLDTTSEYCIVNGSGNSTVTDRGTGNIVHGAWRQ